MRLEPCLDNLAQGSPECSVARTCVEAHVVLPREAGVEASVERLVDERVLRREDEVLQQDGLCAAVD
eukprot:330810-Pleurochrysis_carterae.AAC.2